MNRLFPIAITSLLVCAAVPAYAAEGDSAPTPAQVRAAAEAFDRGREAYKNEDYADAAGQFESADASAPSAAALELAMRARDKAGQLDRAASLAVLALKRYPDDANISKIAPELVKRGKQELYELTVRCDEPCQLTLDGKLVHGSTTTEHVLFLSPGAHTVSAGFSEDRALSKNVEATAGEGGELTFVAPAPAEPRAAAEPETEPEPLETEPEPAPKSEGGWSPTVFYVGAGLTALAGGITIWSGIDTQNNPGPDRVKEECVGKGESCPLYQEGLSKQHRTNILLGVTAGLGIGTILIAAIATDWGGGSTEADEGTTARKVTIQPWVALGDGAALGATGRF